MTRILAVAALVLASAVPALAGGASPTLPSRIDERLAAEARVLYVRILPKDAAAGPCRVELVSHGGNTAAERGDNCELSLDALPAGVDAALDAWR